jgi:thiazole synthase
MATNPQSSTLSLTLNGEPRRVAPGSIADLVRSLELDPAKVAVERNGAIVPRSTLADVALAEGDVLEIVHFVGGGQADAAVADDSWTVAGRTFRSRLIVGTGKYKDFAQNAAALAASGAEIVTVAVRRVNVSDPKAPMLTDYIDPKKVTYLPNTAGCFTAEDAIRTLRLAREAGGWDWSSWKCWARRARSIPTCARPCAPPKCWPRKGSCRWSIAPTIPSPRAS